MKTNILFVAIAVLCASVISRAQIQMDKRVELTGNGSDAKITGIKEVTNDEDAVNKKYVDSLVTANSGGIDLDFTFTSSANSVSGGSSNNNTPAITLTATAFAGKITPISVNVSGVPAGATYTLTPSSGYPVPSLSMSLVFNITSVTPGSYPITVTASGGITPEIINLTLVILAKRVFVTSTKYNGQNINGLSGGDAICQARANAAGLGSTWVAWLSNTNTNAKDRIADATYVRLDGQVVAGSKADLTDGSLQNPIHVTEFGTGATWPYLVWTGTNANGTTATNRHCSDWYSSSTGQEGWSPNTDSWWTSECCGGLSCGSNPSSIYCFEQ